MFAFFAIRCQVTSMPKPSRQGTLTLTVNSVEKREIELLQAKLSALAKKYEIPPISLSAYVKMLIRKDLGLK